MTTLNRALSELQDVLFEADCWVEALRAPDDAPSWTYAVSKLVERIKAAAEVVDGAARAAAQGGGDA